MSPKRQRKSTSTGDREALQDWLDDVDTEDNENIDTLLGRLRHSTDILPAGYCSQLDLPQGSSYAAAAQMIAAERKYLSTKVAIDAGRKAVELTEAEFELQYPLLTNHLSPNASWAVNDNRGCLFETYGKEMDFVRQQDPRTVWTLVSCDDEDSDEIISGFCHVNRMGYLVSTVPVVEGTDVYVQIPRGEYDVDEETDDESDE